MARAVTSSTFSGASSSRNILHNAGKNVRGGQLMLGTDRLDSDQMVNLLSLTIIPFEATIYIIGH